MRVFEISDRKNEVEQMLEFLRKVKLEGHYLVGFNCCGYDYPLLHFILEKARKAFAKNEKLNITIKEIYKYNQSLFEQMKNSQFGTQIRTDDVIIPQIDLFLIHPCGFSFPLFSRHAGNHAGLVEIVVNGFSRPRLRVHGHQCYC